MIDHVLISCLVCLAVHVAFTWPDMILERVGLFLHQRLPIWLLKPLIACLPCMGFWYSAILWILAGGDFNIFLLMTSLATIGANAIIALLIRLIEAVENLERFDDGLQDTTE